METKDCFAYLVDCAGLAVAGTVDKNGTPFTDPVDLLDWDDNGVYFIADKTTDFYRRLSGGESLSLTGWDGKDPLSRSVLTLRGRAVELGSPFLPRLFRKAPYLEQRYPSQISRRPLTVFCLGRGTGERITSGNRECFSFGEDPKKKAGFFITDRCVLCRFCYAKCPQKCIDISRRPAVIQQDRCLRCGNCYEICLTKAIVRQPAE